MTPRRIMAMSGSKIQPCPFTSVPHLNIFNACWILFWVTHGRMLIKGGIRVMIQSTLIKTYLTCMSLVESVDDMLSNRNIIKLGGLNKAELS